MVSSNTAGFLVDSLHAEGFLVSTFLAQTIPTEAGGTNSGELHQPIDSRR